MDSEQPEVRSPEQQARLRHQLAHAERLLADAQAKLVNVSAFSDGNSWGVIDPRRAARQLNAKISEGQDIPGLEADVARLRRQVGLLPRPGAPDKRRRR